MNGHRQNFPTSLHNAWIFAPQTTTKILLAKTQSEAPFLKLFSVDWSIIYKLNDWAHQISRGWLHLVDNAIIWTFYDDRNVVPVDVTGFLTFVLKSFKSHFTIFKAIFWSQFTNLFFATFLRNIPFVCQKIWNMSKKEINLLLIWKACWQKERSWLFKGECTCAAGTVKKKNHRRVCAAACSWRRRRMKECWQIAIWNVD